MANRKDEEKLDFDEAWKKCREKGKATVKAARDAKLQPGASGSGRMKQKAYITIQKMEFIEERATYAAVGVRERIPFDENLTIKNVKRAISSHYGRTAKDVHLVGGPHGPVYFDDAHIQRKSIFFAHVDEKRKSQSEEEKGDGYDSLPKLETRAAIPKTRIGFTRFLKAGRAIPTPRVHGKP
ncbi:PREDICTED: uncharacterized protein LOC106815507 [Priapulus caudatus]|uniref:Uncharacterized protein LOC106815507 n=1 Tax=Priapulus caudatus TaxID=37621 RepID=A0ABM1ETD6_PRICU|nr:PREDICTED: uncharacterized protein LOC106815507 [Priapulus caudatus]